MQIQGRTIYYDLQGPDDGVSLVFLNGLTQYSSLWTYYAAHFVARGVRVLSFDMLGQGQSDKPILSIKLDDHQELLKALTGQLGIDAFYLAGISYGGVVAQRFAIAHPERLRGLALMSTFSEMSPQLQHFGALMYEGLTRLGLPFLQSMLFPLNLSSEWLGKNAANLAEMKRKGYIINDLYAMQNLCESFATFEPFTDQLRRITCPTLILNGEYDFLTARPLHDILRQEIPDSRLVVIQHAYHAFTLEYPEITCRLLGDFVQMVEQGRWWGRQTCWIAADDPQAPHSMMRCTGDVNRAVPLATIIPPDADPEAPDAVSVTGLPATTVNESANPASKPPKHRRADPQGK
jgi:pimeloyl-ACP methyl ester carboxylesterase